jgi:hypothetical protein
MGRARDRYLCAAALESQLGTIPQLLSWESSLESISFKLVLFVLADLLCVRSNLLAYLSFSAHRRASSLNKLMGDHLRR